jgi:tetraacyldisaccharide 4'-kinase
MARANVVVFTRTETMPGTTEAINKLTHFPVFAAATRLLGFRRLGGDIHLQQLNDIGAGPFLAFCGLGNPNAFLGDLRNWGLALCGHAVYSDHHRYTARDIAEIKTVAKQAGARALVTTEKDEKNLLGQTFEELPVYVSVIDLIVSPQADFANILNQACAARSRPSA